MPPLLCTRAVFVTYQHYYTILCVFCSSVMLRLLFLMFMHIRLICALMKITYLRKSLSYWAELSSVTLPDAAADSYQLQNKYVRLRGLAYIHTCRSYVHTPRDFTNGASLAWRLRRCISMVMFACGWAWPARWPIRPILGFWGSKVPQNMRLRFPALDADEPPCKNWRR